ncbi:MAG: CBS and ACT domain-containing protein [Desulfobacca sp.]|nr:CBS and ACT domain-containing protein [Desulfobacca sp.]
MRVGRIMISKPITVAPDSSVHQALKIMQQHSIRHLPVVDGEKFVGWVTARDLQQVLLAAMIEKITVRDVMVTDPLTVTPLTGVDEAAHLMHDYKIGGVPVLEKGKLVGVLTVADLLSAFLYMLDVLRRSSRLDLVLADRPGAFEEACQLIHQAGGKVINVGLGLEGCQQHTYSFRLDKCDLEPIIKSLKERGHQVLELIS